MVLVTSKWAFYRHWALKPCYGHIQYCVNTQGHPGGGGSRVYLGLLLKHGREASRIYGTWGSFENTELPHTSPTKSGFIFLQNPQRI